LLIASFEFFLHDPIALTAKTWFVMVYIDIVPVSQVLISFLVQIANVRR
jgi:hypothetical protein